MAILQQWCGINVIFNYAQEIFMAAGYGVSDVLMNIVVTGITNVIFTILAMFVVDRWGRKALTLIGSFGLAVIYTFMGAAYYFQYHRSCSIDYCRDGHCLLCHDFGYSDVGHYLRDFPVSVFVELLCLFALSLCGRLVLYLPILSQC